ncbi:HlyD family secretion protein [Clostridium cavendishii DSM 21758]|uniref:HlyD family secretion protein n=1 Tax=Clostridium cavendishii DSM 21758 TaxID=1121302 RepID=A0A1M6F0B3_9CLOT|nr:efflux RND transporter periplasmic adaptor subunit [Clostridium cavendishii]SHI91091.1 HlyD family secretion protein [Clostridium cavendishii DSM 21758]
MKKNMVKIIVIAIVAVVSIGGLAFAYSKYSSSQKVTASQNTYISMKTSKQNIKINVQGTGSVVAEQSSDIMGSVQGNISGLNLKVGDKVKAGQTICTISSDQLDSAVSKANSNISKQNIQLTSLQNQLQNTNTQLQNAQNDLNTAKTQLQTATGNDAKTLNDKINTLQNQINTQTNNISSLQNQIATQNINISDAKNDLKTATDERSKATIVAPIDGIVTAINNQNGDSTQSGKAILSLVNTNSYKVKVSVDELDIAKIREGLTADITFGALKDKKFTGKVSTVSLVGTTTNNVTTYDVYVQLDSTDGVALGMTANVSINVDGKDNALVVPSEAITERNGKKYVMVPNETDSSTQNVSNSNQNSQKQKGQTYGKGNLVEIKTGLENENYVEVLDGLTEGQKVLVMLPKSTNQSNQNMRQGGFGGNSGFGGGQNFGGGSQNKSQKGASDNSTKK